MKELRDLTDLTMHDVQPKGGTLPVSQMWVPGQGWPALILIFCELSSLNSQP